MSQENFYIDKTDSSSVENLIDAFNARNTDHENAIRAVLALHESAFTLRVEYSGKQISPLHDAFTFDVVHQELVLLSEEPDVLVDAILEMAMFLRGFETLMGANKEWKTAFAIGTWRYIRRAIKQQLHLELTNPWRIPIESEAVEKFDESAFELILFLTSRPEVEIIFPRGSNAQLVNAHKRLRLMMETIVYQITLEDHALYNRRLARTIDWIESSLHPGEPSEFDDFFGPDGFNEDYFDQ